MKVLRYLWDHLEEIITVTLTAAMTLFVLFQFVFRYFFGSPLSWTEEAARFSYVWITFIGMSLCFKEKNHIEMSIFASMLPRRRQMLLQVVVYLILITAFIIVLPASVDYVRFIHGSLSSALEVRLSYVAMVFPLGLALAILRLLTLLRDEIRGLKSVGD